MFRYTLLIEDAQIIYAIASHVTHLQDVRCFSASSGAITPVYRN